MILYTTIDIIWYHMISHNIYNSSDILDVRRVWNRVFQGSMRVLGYHILSVISYNIICYQWYHIISHYIYDFYMISDFKYRFSNLKPILNLRTDLESVFKCKTDLKSVINCKTGLESVITSNSRLKSFLQLLINWERLESRRGVVGDVGKEKSWEGCWGLENDL